MQNNIQSTVVISCDRSGRIVFDYVCTEPLSACHPTFFTEARCPEAGCPSTHNQKYEIPHRPKEIYLKSFYDYKYLHRKDPSLSVTFKKFVLQSTVTPELFLEDLKPDNDNITESSNYAPQSSDWSGECERDFHSKTRQVQCNKNKISHFWTHELH